MKIIDALGIVEVPGTVPTGRLLWVDSISGNDSLARRGCLTVPFKTLTAAKTAAQDGDTIIVMPGSYSEYDLLKNGVNWHFLPGATVSGGGNAIFNAGGAGIVSTISGWGVFSCDNDVLNVASVSLITLHALKMESSSGRCVRCGGSSGKVHVRVLDSMYCETNSVIDIDGSSSGNFIEASSILTEGGYAINVSAGGAHVKAHTITAPATAVNIAGGSNVVIDAFEITAANDTVAHNTSAALLTIRGARIISQSSSHRPVYLGSSSASDKVRLANCVLIAHTSASVSIDAATASTRVHFWGGVSANKAIGSNISQISGGTLVNSNIS